MKAKVYVTLKEGVLDPQGQAVARALGRLGFSEVQDARIGKYIEVQLADDVKDVEGHLKQMCEKLLANTVIEEYRYEIVK
ncbi:MAG: phosphoribosylformylglycinamidine synthase subunit PurS [Myxococcales bacterium]|nr:phosphoribosylformylglycinamidine synthase subunit PurS [Myxococcales bacterium]